jgi:heptosyltransferase I
MPAEAWSRILVIRLSSLGDVARMLPALRALKGDGRRTVDVTVEDRFAGLLKMFPAADAVVPYPRRSPGPPFRHPLAWSRALSGYISRLREGRYDLALDLHGILRSAVVARLAGARETAGYARGFGREGSHLLYGRALVPGATPKISRYERYAGALGALGFERPGAEFLRPAIGEGAQAEVSAFLEGAGLAGRPYLFAFLGTSRAQAFKRWPAVRFLELARLLWRGDGLPTLLGWGPDEQEEVLAVGRAEGLHVPPSWRLDSVVEAMARSSVFVGADTGTMHIAALMGVPTVALMGPTDPVLNRPFGDRHRIVFQKGVERACAGASCDHAACMGALQAETVRGAVRELLAAGSPGAGGAGRE